MKPKSETEDLTWILPTIPVVIMREAMLTVSPHISNIGALWPMTPEKIRILRCMQSSTAQIQLDKEVIATSLRSAHIYATNDSTFDFLNINTIDDSFCNL